MAGAAKIVAHAAFGLVTALGLFTASPAASQDAWLRGDWCADDGGLMSIDRSGPGFGENTGCKWVGKPPAGERVETQIACVDSYPDGSEKKLGTMRFRAVKTGPKSVSIRVGNGPAVAYAKC